MNELYRNSNALAAPTGDIQPFMVTQADPYRDIAGTRLQNVRNALTATKGYFATGPLNQLAAATRLYQQAQREGRELTPEEDAFISQTAMDVGLNAATFIGAKGIARLGKTDILNKAKAMRDMGVKDEQIWSELGVTFGFADEIPRMELSDRSAKFHSFFKEPTTAQYQAQDKARQFIAGHDLVRKEAQSKPGFSIEGFYKDKPETYKKYWEAKKVVGEYDGLIHPQPKRGPLGQFFEHDSLTRAYPEFDTIKATHDLNYSGGSYIPGMDAMKIGGGAEKSTTLHELQHAIQQREGFARGGSPEHIAMAQQYARESLPGLREDLRNAEILYNDAIDLGYPKKLVDESKANLNKVRASLEDEMALANSKDPYQQYKSLAGESEARLTQARMNLTDAERLAQYPPAQFDVPVGEQIVRFGDSGPSMMADVWHGTPHKWKAEEGFPYGRPRLDHITTGEGNTLNEGWGFYLTQTEAIGKTYREMLNHPAYKGNSNGILHKFDMPDSIENKLLQFDKPLGEQSESVKESLLSIFGEKRFGKYLRQKRTGEYMYNDIVLERTPNDVERPDLWGEDHVTIKTQSLGQDPEFINGGDNYYRFKKAAALWMAEKGIVGNKYPDRWTRAGKSESYNYVISDQKTLDEISRTHEIKADLSKRLNAYIAGRK